MDPLRLHFFLAVAVDQHPDLSIHLAHELFAAALSQYYERHPLAGCVLTQGDQPLPGFPQVITVGRN